MKRENRYLVVKRSDLQAAFFMLRPELSAMFETILKTIELARKARGKPPLCCVVVESDWPEYEPTWAAIEARVDAEKTVEVDNKHYCNDGKWWELSHTPDGILVKIGQNNRTLECRYFSNPTAAYKRKNKWLTTYNMYCPEG